MRTSVNATRLRSSGVGGSPSPRSGRPMHTQGVEGAFPDSMGDSRSSRRCRSSVDERCETKSMKPTATCHSWPGTLGHGLPAENWPTSPFGAPPHVRTTDEGGVGGRGRRTMSTWTTGKGPSPRADDLRLLLPTCSQPVGFGQSAEATATIVSSANRGGRTWRAVKVAALRIGVGLL